MALIKLNEDFSILRYKYGWELYHYVDGMDKDKNPKRQLSRMTFHPDIKAISNEIVNRTAGQCKSLEDVASMLDNASQIVTEAIESKIEGE